MIRVLLAEDDQTNQLIIQTMLEKKDIKVTCAKDGNEACSLIALEDYDIVLMDVSMPRLDGISATRRIREINTSRHRIPIIALTAHNLDDVRSKCLDAGVDDFLVKPVSADQLIVKVLHWVQ